MAWSPVTVVCVDVMVMPCIIHSFARPLWNASIAARPFCAGALGGISTPSAA